jgi:hypothetical protein
LSTTRQLLAPLSLQSSATPTLHKTTRQRTISCQASFVLLCLYSTANATFDKNEHLEGWVKQEITNLLLERQVLFPLLVLVT